MSKKKSKSNQPRLQPKFQPQPQSPSPPSPPRGAVEAIEAALEAVRELASRRLEEKLSISRLAGVARELKDLVKVMSAYEA
jgi:hypothetical protein